MLSHAHFTRTTITDVYARYLSWCGDRQACRSALEIETVVLGAGVPYEDTGAQFFNCLRSDWISGEQDAEPFVNAAGANEEYRFLAQLRGVLAGCLTCEQTLASPVALFCNDACRTSWQSVHASAFTGLPLAMPASEYDALLRLVSGRTLADKESDSLLTWLEHGG